MTATTGARIAMGATDGSNVARFLFDQGTVNPDRPATLAADGTVAMTLGQLAGRAGGLAAGLVQHGLRPGDRVVVLVRGANALVPAAAVLAAGGTLVIPPAGRGARLALELAGRAQPAAVFADPSTWVLAAMFAGLRRSRLRVSTSHRHLPGLVRMQDLAESATRPRDSGDPMPAVPVRCPPGAPALISWTTGTTGQPRPVVRTHGVLAAQHAAIDRLRSPLPGDVDLAGLPNLALHDLACGVPFVLPPATGTDPDGRRLREAVRGCGVTTAAGFPTLFERLVHGAPDGCLPLLRSIQIGGAPVGPALLVRLAAVAPNASVTVVYGATEVEPIAAIDGHDLVLALAAAGPGHGLPVGRVSDELELRLDPLAAGEADEDRAAEPGLGGRPIGPARGRILVRGPRVATVRGRSGPEGWLDTGDLGELDERGMLWLLGRSSNGNVAAPGVPGGRFPSEVEGVVAALPDVAAAALVSLPAPVRRFSVLVIEATTGSTGSAAMAATRAALDERGWRIDSVAVVSRIPSDCVSGKIDYRRLRALVGQPGLASAEQPRIAARIEDLGREPSRSRSTASASGRPAARPFAARPTSGEPECGSKGT